MRPFTKLTLAVLFAIIVVAAIAQLVLANGDRPRYPGPVAGTPLPGIAATP